LTEAAALRVVERRPERAWAEWLFRRSILKQLKFEKICQLLGPVGDQNCLDIGSDNGVISYKLRQRGGRWSSADLDPRSVRALRELVQERVYAIDANRTSFQDAEFDMVVIVDFLEHIPDDAAFMVELSRILRPGGTLIVNAPLVRDSWLVRWRDSVGLTDELHGHLRRGYTPESLRDLASRGGFEVERIETHTRTISKFMDSLMVWALSRLLKGDGGKGASRGLVVRRRHLDHHRWASGLYALVYPAIDLVCQLDHLLAKDPGYMIIARARRVGQT
jgi:SAM-dependent methyltransferase